MAMLKKMIGKAKDMAYETVVQKDAEVLAKNLGNKEAIVSYLEKNKIPERKGAYEMLYGALIEKLDDEFAEKLFAKKFFFVERQKLSVLWEEFADANAEIRLQEVLEKVEKRLAKIDRVKNSLEVKEQQLQAERADILTQLGQPTQSDAPKEVQPVVQEKVQPVVQEEVQEVQEVQEQNLEALYQEAQLFGQNMQFDPNIREEVPKEEDEIMKNF